MGGIDRFHFDLHLHVLHLLLRGRIPLRMRTKCMMCVMLPYLNFRLLCLVVVFNRPKQSSARPERLNSRSKMDLETKIVVLLNVRMMYM